MDFSVLYFFIPCILFTVFWFFFGSKLARNPEIETLPAPPPPNYARVVS